MSPSGFGQSLARGTACHNRPLCQPCPTKFLRVMSCGSEWLSAFLEDLCQSWELQPQKPPGLIRKLPTGLLSPPLGHL